MHRGDGLAAIQKESYTRPMNDADRIDALLDLVDPDRADNAEKTRRLVVLGLAERRGKGFWPTNAGWNLLGDLGREFDI